MRVFVAGATGAIGSRLLRSLTAAGHSVVGMTRTPAKAEAIQVAGAEVCMARSMAPARAFRQPVD